MSGILSNPDDRVRAIHYFGRLVSEIEAEKSRCRESGDVHGEKTNLIRLNTAREIRDRLVGH